MTILKNAPDSINNPKENLKDGIFLRSTQFRKSREQNWSRLEKMVKRLEKRGIRSLSAEETVELPILYRAAMSSLAVARTIVLDRQLLLYLENLSLRAYLAVYGPRLSLWECFFNFFQNDFPESVRNLRWHLLVSALICLAGAMTGYFLVKTNSIYFYTIVPDSLGDGRNPAASYETLRAYLFAPWPGFAQCFIIAANFLFRHNTSVALLCFGLGFAFGIPTILLLFYNGLIIGAFVFIHVDKGLGLEFTGWLSIHGVTELTAIILCAAAGLGIGEKILFPGNFTRKSALATFGKTAGLAIMGGIFMLMVAGFIEGGLRQLLNSTFLRFTIAAITGLFWYTYFRYAGRSS